MIGESAGLAAAFIRHALDSDLAFEDRTANIAACALAFELYQRFEEWCADMDETPPPEHSFRHAVSMLYPVRYSSGSRFTGLRLRRPDAPRVRKKRRRPSGYSAPVREAALEALENGAGMATAQRVAQLKAEELAGLPVPLPSHEIIRIWYEKKHGRRYVSGPRGAINQRSAAIGAEIRGAKGASPARIPGKTGCRYCQLAASLGIPLTHIRNHAAVNAGFTNRPDSDFIRAITDIHGLPGRPKAGKPA